MSRGWSRGCRVAALCHLFVILCLLTSVVQPVAAAGPASGDSVFLQAGNGSGNGTAAGDDSGGGIIGTITGFIGGIFGAIFGLIGGIFGAIFGLIGGIFGTIFGFIGGLLSPILDPIGSLLSPILNPLGNILGGIVSFFLTSIIGQAIIGLLLGVLIGLKLLAIYMEEYAETDE